MRSTGEKARVFRVVGTFLLAMAVGTAAFPTLLPIVGLLPWVAAYIAFVVVATLVMTLCTVTKTREGAA